MKNASPKKKKNFGTPIMNISDQTTSNKYLFFVLWFHVAKMNNIPYHYQEIFTNNGINVFDSFMSSKNLNLSSKSSFDHVMKTLKLFSYLIFLFTNKPNTPE